MAGGTVTKLKTDYDYLRMVEVPSAGRKTDIWSVRNRRSNAELGQIKWYSPWRRYCYFPTVQAVYSAGCLHDIQDFIGTQMTLRHTEET